MAKKTIAILEKETEARGQMIMEKNAQIDKQRKEITEIKEVSQRFQDRCDTLERERDSYISKENMITRIINGKSKPVSKIEVLKDLINPQQRIPCGDTTNWSSM